MRLPEATKQKLAGLVAEHSLMTSRAKLVQRLQR